MKKFILVRVITLLLFAMASQSLRCQVIDASICDSTDRFPITKYTSVLRTTQLITIDSVLRSVPGFKRADNKAVLVFNYDPYFYWFRIIIKNQQSTSRQLRLLMAPVGMYDGRLFQKVNGKWQNVAHAGLKYKFEERSYQFTHHVFPFTIEKNSVDTLYLSIDASNVYKSIGFALIQPKELKIFENNIYFVFGIIVGLLLLFFILNLSLFFAFKEKLHLWYALYIAFLFLIVMKNDQLDQQFLGFDSEKAFRLTPYLAIGALAISLLIHVVHSLFKPVLTQNKILNRLTTSLKVIILFTALFHWLVFNLSTDYRMLDLAFILAKFSILLGICIIIIDCLFCIRENFIAARFILAGSFVFMLGSLQRLYFPSTLSFLFPPTTFHVGIIIETFVISMGLISKYRQERKASRKREIQFTDELHKAQLEIQEQTFKQISQEIHDNIGQVLSSVKLDLNSIPDHQQSLNTNKAIEGLTKAIKDLRDISKTLNTDSIAKIGLYAAIVEELSLLERTAKIKYAIDWRIDELQLNPQQELILFRIMQEALHNIVKHAKATLITLTSTTENSIINLLITDNGVGFDLKQSTTGSGLDNIKNRCAMINAECHFASNIGEGTSLQISILANNSIMNYQR